VKTIVELSAAWSATCTVTWLVGVAASCLGPTARSDWLEALGAAPGGATGAEAAKAAGPAKRDESLSPEQVVGGGGLDVGGPEVNLTCEEAQHC
jgi:hypothetical protein